MEIDAFNPDAIAAMPRDKAFRALVSLTSYEQQRATGKALAALGAASKDIDAILARRSETDALIDAEAKKVAEAKERLTQALAAPEPDCLDDDGKRAVVRAMEAKIAELQETGASHLEWLGSLMANLDAERAFVENLLAEPKEPQA